MSTSTVTPGPDSAEMARAWEVYDAAHSAATLRVAELLRWVEAEPGRTIAEIIDKVHEAWDSIPPRPVPVTEAEIAEAHQMISEVLAARAAL